MYTYIYTYGPYKNILYIYRLVKFDFKTNMNALLDRCNPFIVFYDFTKSFQIWRNADR